MSLPLTHFPHQNLFLDLIMLIKMKRFDADFTTKTCDHRNNAELTLTLRIGFKQINPSGGAAEGTYHDYGDATEATRKIIKWTDASWSQWKRTFEREVEKFWSRKFWLINPGGYFAFEDKGQTWIPNVYCRFNLVCRDSGGGKNHHEIEVVRLHRSENWFGSHSTLYDSNDIKPVQKATDSNNKPIMQRAHVHEVGHLMGLGHVAEGTAACPANGDTNAQACYGTTDHDMNSVMGSGMKLRTEHARPWQDAMKEVAVKHKMDQASGTWNKLGAGLVAMGSVWKPKMKRHYPRTPAEVTAGTLITRR
jgi:hypothetical protein